MTAAPHASAVVIQTAADLEKLLGSSGGLTNRNRPRVLIRTSVVPAEQALRWEARLESLRSECGCRTGRVAVLVFSLILLLFALADQSAPAPGALLLRTLGGIAAVIIVGILGKLLGLYRARRRYDRLCHELIARVRAADT